MATLQLNMVIQKYNHSRAAIRQRILSRTTWKEMENFNSAALLAAGSSDRPR
jgi:hypothetical protein